MGRLGPRVVTQLRRLCWIDDRRASGNAYLALGAVTGTACWLLTVWAVQLFQPALVAAVRNRGLEAAIRSTSSVDQWLLVLVWVLAWGWRSIWGFLRVERRAMFNGASLLWLVLVPLAFCVTIFSLASGYVVPVWAPWFAVFAVGYLANGLVVARGWIYLGPGVVSAITLGVAIYGRLFVAPPGVHASPLFERLFGSYEFYAFLYVLLAVLHVVPMAVDAYLGGRELTDAGLPAVQAERTSVGAVPGDD